MADTTATLNSGSSRLLHFTTTENRLWEKYDAENVLFSSFNQLLHIVQLAER